MDIENETNIGTQTKHHQSSEIKEQEKNQRRNKAKQPKKTRKELIPTQEERKRCREGKREKEAKKPRKRRTRSNAIIVKAVLLCDISNYLRMANMMRPKPVPDRCPLVFMMVHGYLT